MSAKLQPRSSPQRASDRRRIVAFGVHLLTASGAAFGLLALHAAAQARWSAMFAWLGVALLIDGIDGTFARRLEVQRLLPRWSGDVLDLVVDYLNYVLVPAFAVFTGGLLPQSLALPATVAVLVTSAVYFADRQMKTDDGYFRGFPAVWNIVALYLFLLRPEPTLAAVAVLGFVLLTFAPVPFVHPLRAARLRSVNLSLLALWSLLVVVALVHDLAPPAPVIIGLVAIAVYFLTAGLARSSRSTD